MTDESRFLKQEPNKKSKYYYLILILKFSYTYHYKTCWHNVWSAKKKKRKKKEKKNQANLKDVKN